MNVIERRHSIRSFTDLPISKEDLNAILHPDFNILGILSYRTNDTRLELNSPEYQYYRQTLGLLSNESDRKLDSAADAEGWDAWFVIFGVAGKKGKILKRPTDLFQFCPSRKTKPRTRKVRFSDFKYQEL